MKAFVDGRPNEAMTTALNRTMARMGLRTTRWASNTLLARHAWKSGYDHAVIEMCGRPAGKSKLSAVSSTAEALTEYSGITADEAEQIIEAVKLGRVPGIKFSK